MSINPLDKFIEQKKKYDESIRKDGEAAFKEYLKEWFAQNPDVYGVKWCQYTPYFNDGDACEFSLHGVMAFKDKDAFDEATDCYDGSGEELYGKGTLEDTLSSIEDILEAAFGDHAIVSATRDEIVVDEYLHD